MIKPFSGLAVVFLSLLVASCSSIKSFQVIDDTSGNSKKYARTQKLAGIVTQPMFDYFIKTGRTSIVSDKEINKARKKALLDELDNLQFKENQYLYFTMVYNTQFLDDELALSFDVLDKNNTNYSTGNTLIYQKLYVNGVLESVNYSYVIYCNESMAQAIKSKDMQLVVNFPDGASRVYKVSL